MEFVPSPSPPTYLDIDCHFAVTASDFFLPLYASPPPSLRPHVALAHVPGVTLSHPPPLGVTLRPPIYHTPSPPPQTALTNVPGVITDLASSSVLVPIAGTPLLAGLRYGTGPRDGARLLLASTKVC